MNDLGYNYKVLLGLLLIWHGLSSSRCFAQDKGHGLSFRVKAFTASHDSVAVSNVLHLKASYKLFVPDAFTPNGDGINDVFTAKGRSIASSNLVVYDRSGQSIYKGPAIDGGWDGTYRGQEVAAGAYSYKLTARTTKAESIVRSGRIIVMR